MSIKARLPAVAGLFYPEKAEECRYVVASLLNEYPCKNEKLQPRALIVPHAGYVYSGPVAAQAYNRLYSFHDKIKQVVLLGPSHRVPLRGMALSGAEYFTTPLGDIPLALSEIKRLSDVPHVRYYDKAHQQEHSLEVQLPFLQRVLDEFALIPVVVGESEPVAVEKVLTRFWGQPDTLILVSSDLSHYLTYNEACEFDVQTSKLIELKRPILTSDRACGCYALNGLLLLANHEKCEVTCLALANSGDTAGNKNRVVGYGAYVVY